MSMDDRTAPETRRAARVILLDQEDNVLLLRGKDSTRPESESWWFTLGGELEEGESAAQAAIREVQEETGLRLPAVQGPIYAQAIDLVFEGLPVHQSEHFFAARVSRFTVTDEGRTALEKRTLSESRWWSADEVETTTETIYPSNLAVLVRRAAAMV
jgi:8-oxo-dGTP pyrophosphatase MutT (NUDIX family)